LQALLPQSPRTFGHPPSLWTVELAAEVSFAQGLTRQRVSREALRTALHRLAASHAEWAVGFEDEPWWSRVAQPTLPAWTPTQQPLRVVEQIVPS
jgi:hypothetical protein